VITISGALDLATGKQRWSFGALEGPVVSTPHVFSNGKIIFGSWDRHLYALDAYTGVLSWKWNNGSMVRNFAPASCIPVVQDDIVYIVAPDRYLTAIDINTGGNTLWRTKEVTCSRIHWYFCRWKMAVLQNHVGWICGIPNRQNICKHWHGKKITALVMSMYPICLLKKTAKYILVQRMASCTAVDPYTREKLWRYTELTTQW
jgi:hypothetical protein